jgi:uncharacterized oligopeptide transporter (OPT) family protein
MGIISIFNAVQTTTSAGESLAANILCTLPALIFCTVWEEFHYFQATALITLGGFPGRVGGCALMA